MVNEPMMSPPWVIMYRIFKALFGEDSEITINFNDETDPSLKLYVANKEKADALMNLLPKSIDFSNVTMAITVYPPITKEFDKTELFKKAFAGNPVIKDSVVIEQFGGKFVYNIFAKKVVQFLSDDIGDVFSVESTLYEDIAREIFGEIPGVFFCTDVDEEPIK